MYTSVYHVAVCLCDRASADASVHGPAVCVFVLIVNSPHLLAQNHSAAEVFCVDGLFVKLRADMCQLLRSILAAGPAGWQVNRRV